MIAISTIDQKQQHIPLLQIASRIGNSGRLTMVLVVVLNEPFECEALQPQRVGAKIDVAPVLESCGSTRNAIKSVR
jgi:hypothetical protein